MKKVERIEGVETLIYKENMIPLKKNTWLLPEKICIIHGNSVALNLMFETKFDHHLFLQLWNKYLGDMTDVINYHLSPTDWTIMFKTKSSEKIIKSYIDQRIKSKKAKKSCQLNEPKRRLSEHIRIFLSQYVRLTNLKKGRRGTKVLERFRKYILQDYADYERIFSIISNQIHITFQSNKRYHADERYYDLKNEIQVDDICKVGNHCYFGELYEGRKVLKSMLLLHPKDPVLRNFYPKSFLTHFNNNTS